MIKTDLSSIVDKKFIGVPYIDLDNGADDLGFNGTNCMGICVLWLKEQGYDYSINFRVQGNLKKWWVSSPMRFMNEILNHGKVVHFGDLRKYDILLFFSENDNIERFPTHVAVMVNDRHYLSADPRHNGSFVKMLSLNDKRKFFGGIRLNKVLENIYG